MIEDVTVVAYGAPATGALADAVRSAQAGAPLSPVTVVVGSNFAGLVARRRLGSTVGVANVGFLTAFRLAELLAADRLLDRSPITNPVLGAAVRRVLADDPGPFRRVRDHAATESALGALYAELSNVSPAARERLAGSGLSTAVSAVRFHRDISAHLAAFHDEADLAGAAAQRADLAQVLEPFGTLVWFLPEPMNAPLVALVRAVLIAAPSRVIVGMSGDPDADRAVRDLVVRAGVDLPAADGAVPVPVADSIVSVTDADEEVRTVLRRVVELADAGVPLDRIGVFHPTPDPYVATIEQQFAAAGIPANGPSRRRLSDSVAGRTLLGALELPARRWRRDHVMALVAGAPVRHAGGLARPTAMEQASREAGVVQDLTDWRRKIAARRSSLQARTGEHDVERDLADLDSLESFIEALAERVGAVERSRTWSERSAAATDLLHHLLGPGHRHTSWPESEQLAFERVEDALTRLAALDALDPDATLAVFVRALVSELDVPLGRNGRFGEGVTYGPLSAAVGHDLDAVFILGCAEGRCPAVRRDDAMLPDAVRELAGGELQLRRDHLHDQHRHFLAALAASPPGSRTLMFPRGDLRSSRAALPSRWLLDSATALDGGQRVHSTTFLESPPDGVDTIHSHLHGLSTAGVAASLAERDQAEVHRHVVSGGSPLGHPTVTPVVRGIGAQLARRSPRLTEWDGNLVGQPIPSTDLVPLSPTRLETWAKCGFRYYLAHIIGLRDRDDPERVLDLSAQDRGTAVHRALEDFMREVIAEGAPPPHQPWTARHRARLREIAEAELDALERRGRGGRTVHWRLSRDGVLATLEAFLDHDDDFRAARGLRPEQVELPFGLEEAEPVRITLANGRTLAFRGKLDRVDVGPAGRRTVLDYKTGKKGYDGLDDDPVRGGATLQLGLYAEAVRQALGASDVETYYWMVNPAAGYKRFGYHWNDERRERLLDVVTAIADGIEGGTFPSVPGEWNSFRGTHHNCTYCPFDDVCPAERGEHAEAKAGAPELRVRLPLGAPEPAESPDTASSGAEATS